MPGRVKCCLCSKRVETNKPRVRIGSDSVWPLFQIHVQRTGLEENAFSLADFICMKCYGMISHHRMSDRGPNKIVKIPKPLDPELIITKNVLRGAARNENENIEANQQSGETSEPPVQPTGTFIQTNNLGFQFNFLLSLFLKIFFAQDRTSSINFAKLV